MKKMFVDENILSIDNVKITTKYPIKKFEIINEKYIVLLKIPHVKLGPEELNNILCYNQKGTLCWRISSELPSNIISKEQIPYVEIKIIDGKLYATDFWGRRFNVDLEDGRLIDVEMVN